MFLNIKILTKSNKIELSEEFMVIWKEDRPPELFCKKRVHRNFAKFTRKHLCQSLFFNKVAGLAKFLRTLFLTEHLWVTASKVWKECRINFRFFSDWYFRIKFCFKCEIFFQFTPEILFMFLISLALTSGYTASIQLSIWRLVVV